MRAVGMQAMGSVMNSQPHTCRLSRATCMQRRATTKAVVAATRGMTTLPHHVTTAQSVWAEVRTEQAGTLLAAWEQEYHGNRDGFGRKTKGKGCCKRSMSRWAGMGRRWAGVWAALLVQLKRLDHTISEGVSRGCA